MDRLGLGAEAMLEANPALLYCSLPGFASDDPRAAVAAWEGVIGAATASYESRAGGDPHYTAVPLASNFAAFAAVNSVVAALIARERTGRGQRIETPLFDAMFEAFGGRGERAVGGPPRPQVPPGNPGGDPLGGGFYRCADDRWVQLIVLRPRHFDWFAARFFPSGWAEEGLADRERLRAEPALTAELRARLTTLFRTRDSWEWERLVNEAGTPLCVCRTTREWLHDEHARATRAVVTLDDPELGPMAQAGFPVALTASRPDDPEPRHALDADRASILAELATHAATPHAAASEPLRGALDARTRDRHHADLGGPDRGTRARGVRRGRRQDQRHLGRRHVAPAREQRQAVAAPRPPLRRGARRALAAG